MGSSCFAIASTLVRFPRKALYCIAMIMFVCSVVWQLYLWLPVDLPRMVSLQVTHWFYFNDMVIPWLAVMCSSTVESLLCCQQHYLYIMTLLKAASCVVARPQAKVSAQICIVANAIHLFTGIFCVEQVILMLCELYLLPIHCWV